MVNILYTFKTFFLDKKNRVCFVISYIFMNLHVAAPGRTLCLNDACMTLFMWPYDCIITWGNCFSIDFSGNHKSKYNFDVPQTSFAQVVYSVCCCLCCWLTPYLLGIKSRDNKWASGLGYEMFRSLLANMELWCMP